MVVGKDVVTSTGCFQLSSRVVNGIHFVRLIFTAKSILAFVSWIHGW